MAFFRDDLALLVEDPRRRFLTGDQQGRRLLVYAHLSAGLDYLEPIESIPWCRWWNCFTKR